MSGEPFRRTFHVRWGDLDFNGHMKNTAYLDTAADVRMMYFQSVGFSLREFERLRVGPVILRDELEYFRELRMLQEIEVTLEVAGLSPDGSRYRLRNEFFGEGRKRAASVTSSGGWLDQAARRLTAPPPEVARALRELSRTDDFAELPSLTATAEAVPDPVLISRVGTIRVHPDFPSQVVAPRDVQVYLPPGYERETSRRYPVLYLQDGQNVFDAASMGKEWQVDETAEARIRAGRIEPFIAVAVANTAARRDEYTPTPVEHVEPDGTTSEIGGKANLYGRFLIEELKPFVDRTYRTRPDAASTAVGGASLGALVSLWLSFEHPHVFGNVLAVSPAAGWDDAVLLRKVAALPEKFPVRIWLDIGLLEGAGAVSGARRLRDALAAKGWKAGEDMKYLEQPGGQHDEISWASRVEAMLDFLYGRDRPPGR